MKQIAGTGNRCGINRDNQSINGNGAVKVVYCKRIQITVFSYNNISHKGTESQRELIFVPLRLRVKKYNLLPF